MKLPNLCCSTEYSTVQYNTPANGRLVHTDQRPIIPCVLAWQLAADEIGKVLERSNSDSLSRLVFLLLSLNDW